MSADGYNNALVPLSLRELELLCVLIILFKDTGTFTFSPERTAIMCREGGDYFAGCAESLLTKGFLRSTEFPRRHGLPLDLEGESFFACTLNGHHTVYWHSDNGQSALLLKGMGPRLRVRAQVIYDLRQIHVRQALRRKLYGKATALMGEEELMNSGIVPADQRPVMSICTFKMLMLLLLEGVNHESTTTLSLVTIREREKTSPEFVTSGMVQIGQKDLLVKGLPRGEYQLAHKITEIEIGKSRDQGEGVLPELGRLAFGNIVRITEALERIRTARKKDPAPPPPNPPDPVPPVIPEVGTQLDTQLVADLVALAAHDLDRTPLTGNAEADLPRVRHNQEVWQRAAALLAGAAKKVGEFADATNQVESLYRKVEEMRGQTLPGLESITNDEPSA